MANSLKRNGRDRVEGSYFSLPKRLQMNYIIVKSGYQEGKNSPCFSLLLMIFIEAEQQLATFFEDFLKQIEKMVMDERTCKMTNGYALSMLDKCLQRGHFAENAGQRVDCQAEIFTQSNLRRLEKKEEDSKALDHSDDYHQILDFLRASHIRSPELGPPAILATIDETPYTITEDSVRSQLQLADDGGIDDLPIAEIYSGMDNLGYVTEGKLTFYKNKFSPQWRFLVHTILHCLSTKSGSWDQFGSSLAVALICLSDGRKFNWSSYIFKGMVSNIGNAKKFLMYPRFLQTILGIETSFTRQYHVFKLSSKLFANMKLNFEGQPMQLLAAMLPQDQEGEGAGVAAQAVPPPIPEPIPEPMPEPDQPQDHLSTPPRQQTSDPIDKVEDEPLGGSFHASPPSFYSCAEEGGEQDVDLDALLALKDVDLDPKNSALYSTGWTKAKVESFTDAQLKEEFEKIQKALANTQVQAFSRTLKRTGPELEEPSSKQQKSTESTIPSVPDVPQPPVVSSPKSSGTRRKSLGRNRLTKPKSILKELDLDADDKTFIKVVSDEDSTDEAPILWSALAGWEVISTPLGEINALYRSDQSTKHFTTLREILHMVDRQDLLKLYGMVVTYYENHLVAGAGLMLWGDLQVLMDSQEGGKGSFVWNHQSLWQIRSWRLYTLSNVHVLETVSGEVLYMFADVSYPLSVKLMERMLKHKLEIDKDVVGNDMTTAEQLIRFIKNQIAAAQVSPV
ncbi:hypothetical protein Tco_1562471 [Tanacetum coccineum]